MLTMLCNTDKFIVFDPSSYFDNMFEATWLEDKLVKRMIQDVDNSTVTAPYCIESPALGQISPFMLSGGVKGLIVLLKEDLSDIIMATAAFGDNCAKWLSEIANSRDIELYISHTLEFDVYPKQLYMKDSNKMVTNPKEYYSCVSDALHSEDMESRLKRNNREVQP